ncbi:7TM diverse intracellular signaling domain-containing protein [Hugenholtzia roseola]|uniref:7TM diverse intracellular signaling domain-containing protein n=1 Tax=Hugenholtzia roseola TaxID=1002 RepID=UPI0004206F36|nr:7TM diverse intracellular signaling domain-containing protein [Hugenholtzia roseola]
MLKKLLQNLLCLLLSTILFPPSLLWGQQKLAEPYAWIESSQKISFKDKSISFLIGESVSFYEEIEQTDAEGKVVRMDIAQIVALDKKGAFLPNDKPVFARPASTSRFWFRFTVENHTDEDIWINVGSTYPWFINFYALDSADTPQLLHQTGSMRPEESKAYPANTFWLPINKKGETQPKVYYLSIDANLTLEVPIEIGTLKSLHKTKTVYDFLTAGFGGLIIIMLLYNGFLYASTREHIYGYYMGYLATMMFGMMYANNYPFFLQWDFGFINRYNLNQYFILWHAPAYFFVGMFCIKYLDLSPKKGNFGRKAILTIVFVMVGIYPILSLLGIVRGDLLNIFQALVMVLYLTCLITAYYFVYKKDPRARFYALGWTLLMAGAFCFFSVANGIAFTYNPYTRSALYFGVALEVWMFSLALGDRLNLLRKERERERAEKLQLIEEQNAVLERKIQERTAEILEKNLELQEKNDEIQQQSEEISQHNEELSSILEVMQSQNELIKKSNEEVKASIVYASRIQNALLPQQERVRQLFDEFFVLYLPRDIVSGDFYWCEEVGEKLILVLADCTGHGVPGAFMSTLGISALNSIVFQEHTYQPDQILNKLHFYIYKALRQDVSDNTDGMDVSVLVIDRAAKKAQIAAAMSPIYCWQNQTFTEIKADKMPIGSRQYGRERHYQTQTVDLESETTFYLASDGYQDQFGGKERKKFMKKRFKELLAQNAQEPLPQQQEKLSTTLQNWVLQGGEKQIDDIVVLGVKVII